jgi:serine protease Do
MKHIIFLILSFIVSGCTAASDLSNVFQRVDPAVVVIQTKESVTLDSKDGVKKINTGGLGSGIIIDKSGIIMTAAHVVENADQVNIHLVDGRVFSATIISASTLADVALIQINDPPADLTFVEPWDSNKVKTGEKVFVIGSPYGLEHTLTVGYLSGRRITDGEESLMDLEFLQTDAAVNQGNSGGPLFNKDGRLIGIVSHIRTQSGGNEGLGFAASINMAKRLMLDEGPFWFGVQFIPLTEKFTAALNIPYKEALLVQRVAKGSLGEALSLREGGIPIEVKGNPILLGGDVVVEMGGETIFMNRAGRSRLFDYIHSIPSGGEISVTVMREGKKVILTATVPDRSKVIK